FSRAKQVKLDDWQHAGDDAIEVLKVNFTKKFVTGIYPYSLMFSAFTPTDGGKTLKTTMSGQEWCGHVFSQLNLRGENYEAVGFSYLKARATRAKLCPPISSKMSSGQGSGSRPTNCPRAESR